MVELSESKPMLSLCLCLMGSLFAFVAVKRELWPPPTISRTGCDDFWCSDTLQATANVSGCPSHSNAATTTPGRNLKT